MERYRQTSKTISVSSNKELEQKAPNLGACGNMDITIKPTTPLITDTNQWYIINYWVRE